MAVVITGINIYPKLGPKVDKDFFRLLKKEGIIFDSKKVWLTFRAKNLRGKGIYASSLIRLSRGQLLITKSRFIALAGGHKIIDIPKNHLWFKKLIIDKSEPNRYKITLDLDNFSSGFKGIVSLAYHIDSRLVEEK